MGTVELLPVRREMFLDARGEDRGLRVTTHSDEGIVVVSVWHGDRCTASFQLPIADCGRLASMLAASLGDRLAGLPAQVGRCYSTDCGEACCSGRRDCSG